MENSNDKLWKAKLAARIHDPAEKALVLLRDPAGHENGTSSALARLTGLTRLPGNIDPDNDEVLSKVVFKQALPRDLYEIVQRADWWAAAADRPQWPMQEITVTTKKGGKKTFAVANWAQVRWTQQPVLTHPLTGEQYDLGKHGGLGDTDFADIKQRSFAHFSKLLDKPGVKDEASRALRKTLLAFWRFGPELAEDEDFGKLGQLWKLLPADTRVPDHSIWDHLDLTSAFAGAFAADPKGEAALLALSIGPVQPFIAAARTTSDLWAGSHLVSRLAWEAMRPVCEALGPDAILFPRLRGIPQVDLWLRDQMGLPDDLFLDCAWMKGATDANPLFAAALPNRFVAVVPASRATAIAEEVTQAVRGWLQQLGQDVVMRLLEVAGFDLETTHTPYEQMKAQIGDFPEVHWAAVPFSLIKTGHVARQTDLDTSALSAAMAPFFGAESGEPCGFLDTPAWEILQKEIDLGDDTVFFAPNPGVLYPAVYDLAERVLAAAKSARTFRQCEQKGWRCSLTGETEWLTTDKDRLAIPAGRRRSRKDERGFIEGVHHETLWTKVADEKPAWAKKGEHLGALPAIKRLWPTLFAEEVGKALDRKGDGTAKAIDRFVVSTHTMALARDLEQLAKALNEPDAAGRFAGLVRDDDKTHALPRSLAKLRGTLAARIPAALDRLRESEAQADGKRLHRLEAESEAVLGHRLETYYALLMMDGDHMGEILSGAKKETAISYRASFHPQVQKGFDDRADKQPFIREYGRHERAISPNRHLAISGALNDFSQTVVRHVVEEEHPGRVIYAGGDDVLAMLPVADLLPAMQRLRHAYSGSDPEHEGGVSGGLTLQKGFAMLKTGHGDTGRLQLMRMMGRTASASCGAVIAHHQAPLGAVLRELRAAEQRAKNEGGRDAFSITVVKRSGGALRLTEKWGEPVSLLGAVRDFLAIEGTSHRAVYNTLEWLTDLPDPKTDPAMLESLLAYQLARQSRGEAGAQTSGLARRLARLAVERSNDGLEWLTNFLGVAEFLARETRTGGQV